MNRLILLYAFVGLGCAEDTAAARPPAGPSVATGGWIVTAASALTSLDAVTLLDVRGPEAYAQGHVRGAALVDWLAFSAGPDHERGALHPDDARLSAVISALGVRADRPVRVIGDPVSGWGEDGRVVWSLRTLGHPDVAFVDGGHAALVAAGAAIEQEPPTIAPSAFTVQRRATWSIETPELLGLVQEGAASAGRVVLVDARERREYDGETPYGEARGGHLPGAVHLHYRSLLTSGGYLLPRDGVLQLLEARGITPARPVVVYCTGGVRSGWFVAVLTELGFQSPRNYAGSMWSWAAGPPGVFLLE